LKIQKNLAQAKLPALNGTKSRAQAPPAKKRKAGVTVHWVSAEGGEDDGEIDFCVRKEDWDAFVILVFLQVPELEDLNIDEADGLVFEYTWDLGHQWKAFCGTHDLAQLISAGRDVFMRVAPLEDFIAPGEVGIVRSTQILYA
jgi:hypothetical protein